jgi:hypothetical protein
MNSIDKLGEAWLKQACFESDNSRELGEKMAKEMTLVELRTSAERSGLRLSDEELEQLLPGINRSHNQALELREFITDSVEPAATFVASRTENR